MSRKIVIEKAVSPFGATVATALAEKRRAPAMPHAINREAPTVAHTINREGLRLYRMPSRGLIQYRGMNSVN